MSYPKPLSEKSLRRLYGECGLSDQKVIFLRTFFEACANLYGVIVAEEPGTSTKNCPPSQTC